MKTALDLLQRFSEVNEVKIALRGHLPIDSERRWRDLKIFYDKLMSPELARSPRTGVRFSAAEIRRRLPHRGRLRLKVPMGVFFTLKDNYITSRAIDLSRGGMFVSSPVLLPVDSQVTVYLPNLGKGYETLFETPVEVIWLSEKAGGAYPRGMGVRFRELNDSALEQLDAFIVRLFQDRLSRWNEDLSAPELAQRRQRAT